MSDELKMVSSHMGFHHSNKLNMESYTTLQILFCDMDDKDEYILVCDTNGVEKFTLHINKKELDILYNTLKIETEGFIKHYHLEDKLKGIDENFDIISFLNEIARQDEYKYESHLIKICLNENLILYIADNHDIVIDYYDCKLCCYNDMFLQYNLCGENNDITRYIYAIVLMNRIESFINKINKKEVIA